MLEKYVIGGQWEHGRSRLSYLWSGWELEEIGHLELGNDGSG